MNTMSRKKGFIQQYRYRILVMVVIAVAVVLTAYLLFNYITVDKNTVISEPPLDYGVEEPEVSITSSLSIVEKFIIEDDESQRL